MTKVTKKAQKKFNEMFIHLITEFGAIPSTYPRLDDVFTADELKFISRDEQTYVLRTITGVYQIIVRPDNEYSIFIKCYRTNTYHNLHCSSADQCLSEAMQWLNNQINTATDRLCQQLHPMNTHYPVLDTIVASLRDEILRKINATASAVEVDGMPYQTQYVLETLIKELESRV